MQPVTVRHPLLDRHSNQPLPHVTDLLCITIYCLIIRLYSTASNFFHPVQIQTPAQSHWTVPRRRIAHCNAMAVTFTAPYSHTVRFCHRNLYSCLVQRSFCEIFESNLQWPQIWPCWFSLNISVSFQAHWLAHMRQIRVNNESSLWRNHLLSCACCFLTAWSVFVHKKFSACWIPAQT